MNSEEMHELIKVKNLSKNVTDLSNALCIARANYVRELFNLYSTKFPSAVHDQYEFREILKEDRWQLDNFVHELLDELYEEYKMEYGH